MLTQAPRGTKDILPERVGEWRYVEEKIRELCERYGFGYVRGRGSALRLYSA